MTPVASDAHAELSSNVYCGIRSLPPVITDERDAVKSAFTPYRSTDRNNQINSFVPSAPASKPGPFYHKWKLPIATAPRAVATVRESEINVVQAPKNSPPSPNNKIQTFSPSRDISVIQRTSDPPITNESTSSTGKSIIDSPVVVAAGTNRPLNLSNYKPFLKLKKEHDGLYFISSDLFFFQN